MPSRQFWKSLFKISVPALVAALVLCTYLLASNISFTMQSGTDSLFDTTRPNFIVPAGAKIFAVDGVPVTILSRTSVGDDDAVQTAFLDPGVYKVVWANSWFGAAHFPSEATITLVAPVVFRSFPSSSGIVHRLLLFALLCSMLVSAWLVCLLRGRGFSWACYFLAASVATFFASGFVLGIGVSGYLISFCSIVALGLAVLYRVKVVALSPMFRFSQMLLVSGATLSIVFKTDIYGAVALLFCVLPAVYTVKHFWSAATNIPTLSVPSLPRFRTAFALATAFLGVFMLLTAVSVTVAATPVSSSDYPPLSASVCRDRYVSDVELGVDCFRALAATIGATSAPEMAASQVLSLASSAPDVFHSTTLCRQMGVAMSTAAARWGPGRADPRSLFVRIGPVCFYSTRHGVAFGVLSALSPQNYGSTLAALCNAPSPDSRLLPDSEFYQQCWQGAGIALARLTAFDPVLFDVCAQPDTSSSGNCVDGVFREMIDQQTRAYLNPVRNFVPSGVTVASLCRPLLGKIIANCYRYIAMETVALGGTDQDGVTALTALCRGDIPASHRSDCWYSLGMVFIRANHEVPMDVSMTAVSQLCATAGISSDVTVCVVGAINASVFTTARSDVPALCLYIPAASRTKACASILYLADYMAASRAP